MAPPSLQEARLGPHGPQTNTGAKIYSRPDVSCNVQCPRCGWVLTPHGLCSTSTLPFARSFFPLLWLQVFVALDASWSFQDSFVCRDCAARCDDMNQFFLCVHVHAFRFCQRDVHTCFFVPSVGVGGYPPWSSHYMGFLFFSASSISPKKYHDLFGRYFLFLVHLNSLAFIPVAVFSLKSEFHRCFVVGYVKTMMPAVLVVCLIDWITSNVNKFLLIWKYNYGTGWCSDEKVSCIN